MRPTIEQMTQEVHERTRRIETQLYRVAEAIGLSPPGSKPVWTPYRVDIPTPSVSLKDILAVIPESVLDGPARTIGIWIADTRLTSINVGRAAT